jgi:hypothetical protein
MKDDYQASLRNSLSKMAVSPPPEPWRAASVISVGGLTEVGFVPDSDILLVVSSRGRGMFDCISGERVARDRDENWGSTNETDLTAPGIGPFASTLIRLAGLHGGGLRRTTNDGWAVFCLQLPWPTHYVFLSPPWKFDYFEHWTKIATDEPCEFRACGFSDTGRSLVLATSCALSIFCRMNSQ